MKAIPESLRDDRGHGLKWPRWAHGPLASVARQHSFPPPLRESSWRCLRYSAQFAYPPR
jgi:hypothetical protein